MDAHLRAGAAIYNTGEFHAAHDAWEELWLDMDDGPDRDLLQGLIQFLPLSITLTGVAGRERRVSPEVDMTICPDSGRPGTALRSIQSARISLFSVETRKSSNGSH